MIEKVFEKINQIVKEEFPGIAKLGIGVESPAIPIKNFYGMNISTSTAPTQRFGIPLKRQTAISLFITQENTARDNDAEMLEKLMIEMFKKVEKTVVRIDSDEEIDEMLTRLNYATDTGIIVERESLSTEITFNLEL